MPTDIYPLLAEPDMANHLGFIFAEEAALKEHLTGITVPSRPDGTDRTKVGVWFRWPEGERQIKYPFITIDLLSAEPAFDLFHSDHYQSVNDLYRPSFSPELPEPPGGWGTQNYEIRNFLPFRLLWQVVHHSRSSLHDRYLTSIFITDVFPVRPFWIRVGADDTWRRTEQVNFVASTAPETTESGTKRVFRKIYTINMMAEIPQDRLGDAVAYRTLRVLIPVVYQEQFDSYRRDVLGFPDANLDPMHQFSPEEREVEGELFHIAHEGKDVPSAL